MEKRIFKNASITYYWSSRFFPKNIREDVFKLYSFVRVADDFVDQVPQDAASFYELKGSWEERVDSENPIIKAAAGNINYLMRKHDFERQWVDAFLKSMEQDLNPLVHAKLTDSLDYVYGSAEVVGLMMAKILGLPQDANEAAGHQGRAMQWINFVRDIDEDIRLGRSYFPEADFEKFGLKDLRQATAEADPVSYKKFIRLQIDRYKQWQKEAEAGYKYIPKRLLVPIKTASDMYNWTAEKIENDPFLVYQKKLKPRKVRVLSAAIKNTL